MKGWLGLQSYLGYDSKSIQDSESSNSTNGAGVGGAYGGLSGDDGVNPFQAAMSQQNGGARNENNSDLLNFDDDNNSSKTVNKQNGGGWESQDWGSNVANKNDGWDDNSWDVDNNKTSTQKTSPRAATKSKSPTPKVTKQDSWGNDVDAWEDWLNDDSTAYKPKTKKGD